MSYQRRGGMAFPGPRGNPRPYQPGHTRLGLPQDYLKNGYFDGKGNLLTELIVEWPKKIALALYDSGHGLKPAQLRKFFAEVRLIEGQIYAGKSYDTVKARIQKLEAYANDAVKKDNAPQLFKEFFEINVKWAAKDEKSFLAFVDHFECIVAYFPRSN